MRQDTSHRQILLLSVWQNLLEVPEKEPLCWRLQEEDQINVVEEDDLSSSEDDALLHSIQANPRRRLTALLTINDCAVHFQIGTGADVSTICQKFVYQDQVHPCSRNFVMWNKTTMTPVSETSLQVCNPKNGEVVSVDFIVVKNSFICLLSLSGVRTLNLITVNDNNVIANIATDADLGDLATVTLHIDLNIVPRAPHLFVECRLHK